MEAAARTVVVTGARGRLGRVLVPTLRDAGYRAVEVARGDGANVYEADLLDEASVVRCFDQIAEREGAIDALIHAVGTWDSTPIATTSLADWEGLLRTNLVTTFLCFREAARIMNDGGRLIAFSSGQGADRSLAQQSAYAAAKAGVIRLVESAAAEYRERRITAHAIAPSTILFDDAGGKGVTASDLAAICLDVLSPTGAALNGQVIRAYGI
ncbi:MAG TPA: SDR family oxidoreductase [Rhodothermales bacterium]